MVSELFRLHDVVYHYPDGRAGVDGISLTVHQGDSLVVLGANASGKTTLLQLLAGLVFPASGTVEAFGKPLSESGLREGRFARSFRQRVGVLFQDTEAMLFNPTVYDEIAFAPLQLDLPEEDVRQRVDEMSAFFGLGPVIRQPPHQLSGGERKKVALAAILAASPEVLLLDEPTSGLDPRSQRWFVELAGELRAMGKTLVTTTHDLHVADEIGDRVVVLDERHRLAAEGKPHDILTDLDLLLSVNLVHEHAHVHDGIIHVHPHSHAHEHLHE